MEKLFASLLRRKTLDSIKTQGDAEHAEGHRLDRINSQRHS